MTLSVKNGGKASQTLNLTPHSLQPAYTTE